MHACAYMLVFDRHIYLCVCVCVRMRDEWTSRESDGVERSRVTKHTKSYVVGVHTQTYTHMFIHAHQQSSTFIYKYIGVGKELLQSKGS
jgi:hypothetical protein